MTCNSSAVDAWRTRRIRTPPYNVDMLYAARAWAIAISAALIGVVSPLTAQTPQPFPRPAGAPSQPPPRTAPAPAPAATAPQPAAPQAPPAQTPTPRPAVGAAAEQAPSAATLGFPIYPNAQFLASYDAGRGQRYYLFGASAPYAELVLYYRTQLDERGDVVFKEPPTHVFEVGRFREETMAFPPGVTVKDWTWGGSQGYPNPKPGAQPARFPTVIMIVPPPAAAAPTAR
jgi:hypothetical protein